MKAYTIDTSKYKDEQILDLAVSKGYQLKESVKNEEGTFELVDSSRDRDAIEAFIAEKFKEYADLFFAQRLIEQVNEQIEQTRIETIEAIKEQVSTTTQVTDVE